METCVVFQNIRGCLNPQISDLISKQHACYDTCTDSTRTTPQTNKREEAERETITPRNTQKLLVVHRSKFNVSMLEKLPSVHKNTSTLQTKAKEMRGKVLKYK
jgi:hypothetical protein